MEKDMKQFCKREWKDHERIIKLNKTGLVLELWKERSNKFFFGIMGFLLGIILMTILSQSSLAYEQYCDSMCGDVNGDNYISGMDVTELQDYLTGMIPFLDNQACADVNGDQYINIADVQTIQDNLTWDLPMNCRTTPQISQNSTQNFTIQDQNTTTGTSSSSGGHPRYLGGIGKYANGTSKEVVYIYRHNTTIREKRIYIQNDTCQTQNKTIYINNATNQTCTPEIWYNQTIQYQDRIHIQNKTPGYVYAVIVILLIGVIGETIIIWRLL